MRSNLISGCFLAYGFGNIAINLVTLVIRSAQPLAYAALALVCVSIIPSFFSYVETPKFLYKSGRLSGLIESLAIMSRKNEKNITREDLLKDFTDGDQTMANHLSDKQIRVSVIKAEENVDEEKRQSPFVEMFTNKTYLLQTLTMSLQGGVLYIVFYGMATSVQDLGLKNVNMNGIFFGITQSVGYMAVLPFIHKQKRKTWSIIYQLITLAGGILLAILSKLPDSEFIELMETIVSTCIMAAINSAQFPLFFNYNAELFPTRMRGVANAVILFASKMIGSFAPFVATMSKNHGFHILVGCSSVVLLSLPFSFLIKETFEDSSEDGEKKAKKERGFTDMSYETMHRSNTDNGSGLQNNLAGY
jgi:hypothetical protein